MPAPRVLVAGVGIIGLSVALELRWRGAEVVLTGRAGLAGQASFAAAGMLAAEDPHNPPELLEMARRSAAMYPEFLARLGVPFQTFATVQYGADGSAVEMEERSVDPRQMLTALQEALQELGVRVVDVVEPADVMVHATGAWFQDREGMVPVGGIVPRKGQMLRVKIPAGVRLECVHRAEDVYVVPRTRGPQASTAVVGATVEDVGFDTTVREGDLQALRRRAARLLPWVAEAEMVGAWAGLRPATADGLPVIGELGSGEFVAGGHFRNGVLLAPATAVAIADLIEGKDTGLAMEAFSPQRFEIARVGR